MRTLLIGALAATLVGCSHGRCPTEIDSRRLDGRLPTARRMSPRQAKSRVVNSDCERSGGRRDIGYARSGAEWLYLVVNHRTHW
jgi:hypothetical protein